MVSVPHRKIYVGERIPCLINASDCHGGPHLQNSSCFTLLFQHINGYNVLRKSTLTHCLGLSTCVKFARWYCLWRHIDKYWRHFRWTDKM